MRVSDVGRELAPGENWPPRIRLVDPEQLVQARNEELILIVGSHSTAVRQPEYVDIARCRMWFRVGDRGAQLRRRHCRKHATARNNWPGVETVNCPRV